MADNLQLRTEGLSVGYETGVVVSDVNIEIYEGDYICIVGENGAGKSSLLKGLVGLAQIKAGKIIYGDNFTKSDIGYLPQQKDHQKNFPATVTEVVLSGFLNKMGLRPFYNLKEKAKAAELIAELGMSEFANVSFGKLSGGQKQRVLIARALCATDKMLLLDEPATGLDPVAMDDMYSIVNKLNHEKNVTIVMISHDINKAVKDSDKILHLNEKGVGYFGPAKDYLESSAAGRFLGDGETDGKEEE